MGDPIYKWYPLVWWYINGIWGFYKWGIPNSLMRIISWNIQSINGWFGVKNHQSRKPHVLCSGPQIQTMVVEWCSFLLAETPNWRAWNERASRSCHWAPNGAIDPDDPKNACKHHVLHGKLLMKKPHHILLISRLQTTFTLESRRRRTKGSVVGEEWCQNAAPLRWYTKNVFAQSKMILSRAWLHDTVSCAAWNDAQKWVYLKPLFKTPCSNCYWGWSKPIMLNYRDISLMESVPLLWRTVTASPAGIEPMTILIDI